MPTFAFSFAGSAAHAAIPPTPTTFAAVPPSVGTGVDPSGPGITAPSGAIVGTGAVEVAVDVGEPSAAPPSDVESGVVVVEHATRASEATRDKRESIAPS